MLTIVTPADTHDLTVLASVKLDLQITGTSDDDYLESLIDDASDILAEACNRVFGRETVRQTERPTTCLPSIILDRDINPGITSVAVDGETLDAADYELDGALLYRLQDDCRICWDAGTKVEITYEAGFELLGTLPRSIERACRDMVVSSYRARGRDRNISREQTEGVGSVSYFDMSGAQDGFPPAIQSVVNAWRRIPV